MEFYRWSAIYHVLNINHWLTTILKSIYRKKIFTIIPTFLISDSVKTCLVDHFEDDRHLGVPSKRIFAAASVWLVAKCKTEPGSISWIDLIEAETS